MFSVTAWGSVAEVSGGAPAVLQPRPRGEAEVLKQNNSHIDRYFYSKGRWQLYSGRYIVFAKGVGK